MNKDPDGIHWDEIVEEGREANQLIENNTWKLGDLALEVEGNASYGDDALQRYAQAINVEFNSLKVYKVVAQAYQDAKDRVSGVSFSHHRLAYTRDDRVNLLKKSKREGWSTRQLEKYIKGDKELINEPDPEPESEPESEEEFVTEEIDEEPSILQAGRTVGEVVVLLNYLAEADEAMSYSFQNRFNVSTPFLEEVQNILNEPVTGFSVLDLINCIFIGHGQIEAYVYNDQGHIRYAVKK